MREGSVLNTDTKRCVLCESRTRLEEHHEIPRAYGGHDSQLHVLCVSCHDFIHDTAVAVRGKARRHVVDLLLSMWAEDQLTRVKDKNKSIQLAKKLISSIVKAAETNDDFELIDNPQTIQLEVPRWLRAVLKRVARDKKISVQSYILNTLIKAVESEGFVRNRVQQQADAPPNKPAPKVKITPVSF